MGLAISACPIRFSRAGMPEVPIAKQYYLIEPRKCASHYNICSMEHLTPNIWITLTLLMFYRHFHLFIQFIYLPTQPSNSRWLLADLQWHWPLYWVNPSPRRVVVINCRLTTAVVTD